MKAITHSIILCLILFLFFTYSSENPTAQGFSRPKISSEILSLETVSIRELIEKGETLLGKRIRVAGKLENIGKNYFTDLKVVLKDPDHENGDFIYVRPWLPLEFPPGPPGSRAQEKPETLSQYLGQTVELTAVLKNALLKHVGEVRLLEVESAQIVETNE